MSMSGKSSEMRPQSSSGMLGNCNSPTPNIDPRYFRRFSAHSLHVLTLTPFIFLSVCSSTAFCTSRWHSSAHDDLRTSAPAGAARGSFRDDREAFLTSSGMMMMVVVAMVLEMKMQREMESGRKTKSERTGGIVGADLILATLQQERTML